MATTTSEEHYSNAGDRVCPECESDFIEITEVPVQPSVSVDFNSYRGKVCCQSYPEATLGLHFVTERLLKSSSMSICSELSKQEGM